MVFDDFFSVCIRISFGQQMLTETNIGRALKEFYLSLQVESHWIAGQHVDWETVEPDDADASLLQYLPGYHFQIAI